jgi:hypothetical protein
MKLLTFFLHLWLLYFRSIISFQSFYRNSGIRELTLFASKVALTREAGTNDKLKQLLEQGGVECFEIPCIAFEKGQDINFLNECLYSKSFDIIVISSPQVATLLL